MKNKAAKINLPQKSPKKDFIFNMYGSMLFSFVSVILLVMVSNLLGENQAGVFSLAYSTAQMFYIVSVFEVRNIQVTDEKKEFSASDLFTFRIITVLLMLILAAAFCFLNSFDLDKTVITLLFCVYMLILSFSEFFQGNTHKHGFLYISGFSLGTSVILAAIAFIAAIIFSRNLLISIIPMIIVMLLWVLFFDVPISKQFDSIKIKFDFSKIKKIFLYTLPLVISVFINQYSINSPKYAIDRFLTDIDQSHYGYLVMPAFCINLLSTFVFRPQITTLSSFWVNKEYNRFNHLSALLFLWIIISTFAVIIGGFILGIPVLEWLYAAELSSKKLLFMILLLGGGFSAASSLCCIIVAITRKQNYAIFAYGISALVALIIPNILVKNMGFSGAAFSYLIINIVLFAALFSILAVTVFSKGRKNNEI